MFRKKKTRKNLHFTLWLSWISTDSLPNYFFLHLCNNFQFASDTYFLYRHTATSLTVSVHSGGRD